MLHSLFYLETALQDLGVATAHHQEPEQLYLQLLVFVTPFLLPAAIVVCCGWRTPPTAHLNWFQLFHDSGR
jgi:4-amino-4-deoxy-L-arabinose transferase-like glycosyltransferase